MKIEGQHIGGGWVLTGEKPNRKLTRYDDINSAHPEGREWHFESDAPVTFEAKLLSLTQRYVAVREKTKRTVETKYYARMPNDEDTMMGSGNTFVGPIDTEHDAQIIADLQNSYLSEHADKHWEAISITTTVEETIL